VVADFDAVAAADVQEVDIVDDDQLGVAGQDAVQCA